MISTSSATSSSSSSSSSSSNQGSFSNLSLSSLSDVGTLVTNRVVIINGANKLITNNVTVGELGCLSGITSSVQTQLDSKQATITGAATTIVSANLTASRALASDGTGKVDVSSVTSTELGYLSGVSSSIQTQLNTLTSNANTSNIVASRAVVTNASGTITTNNITSTEVGYLSGVTSAVQTQLDGKQGTLTGATTTVTTANLTASRAVVSDTNGKIAASTVTSNELLYVSGAKSNIQTQIDTITGAVTIAGTNVTVGGNLTVNGAFSLPGTIGFLGSTVLITASNVTGVTANSAITLSTLAYTTGSNFAYASLDSNKTTITFNTDGIYTIGCIRCSHSSSSVTNRQYSIYKYASDGTTLIDQTTPLTAISTVQIGIKATNKISFVNTTNNVTWYANSTPSYWTIVPVTSGFPG